MKSIETSSLFGYPILLFLVEYYLVPYEAVAILEFEFVYKIGYHIVFVGVEYPHKKVPSFWNKFVPFDQVKYVFPIPCFIGNFNRRYVPWRVCIHTLESTAIYILNEFLKSFPIKVWFDISTNWQ